MPDKPPLTGIRVLDFSRLIAGPLCTQQLADLGAGVIKVENPDGGDEGRRFSGPSIAGQSHFFLAFNRSKRSIAIDIRTTEGRTIIDALAAQSDVLVENFRPGIMRGFDLDYATLHARHPRLIYASISAYGQTGPNSQRPGLDPVLQAESGMMALTGEPNGQPLRHPLSLIDTLTAIQAVAAINAALYARGDGIGQHIDLCLMDSAVAALANFGLYYLTSGEEPERTGNSHLLATPTSLFHTQTEPIYLAIATDRIFVKFCRDVLARPELAEDPKFVDAGSRLENRAELLEIVQSELAREPAAVWLDRMQHLPAGAVRTVGEALRSPDVTDRGMVKSLLDSTGETLELLGAPFRFSASSLRAPEPPPRLGEHTDEILDTLGYARGQIDALRQKGVVG